MLLFFHRQTQYEWDISINWVSLHIDGISNARQISRKAEIDLEMVRACLRVLKHHGFIALVDMFCYSNRYECTECMIGSKLLQEAVEYVIKRSATEIAASKLEETTTTGTTTKMDRPQSTSPSSRSMAGHERPDTSSLFYSLATSFPLEMAIKGESYSERFGVGGSASLSQQEMPLASLLKHEDFLEIKTAIVEFFVACNRGVPVGELWIALISKRFNTSSDINWKKMFRRIDHRRLITFGLLHGFIRRVHNFLLLRDREPIPQRSVQPSNDRTKSTNQHISSIVRLDEQEERRKLINKAAFLMDGMHCDDEIVCSIELPLDEIIALFPGNSIISVFASDDS
jgi:Nitrogen permease regulator 2